MAEQKKQDFSDIMEYRMLGGTGLKVSVLGLGSMSFETEEQSMQLMSAVRKYGANFFDNAEMYGNPGGESERLFGAALKKLQEKDAKLWRRTDLVITTKLYCGVADGQQKQGPTRYFGPNDMGLSRKHLMEGIDESLQRLQLDYVDIVYAHRYDPNTPMIEIVQAFTDIIRAGKAFYWGTSMWNPQKLTEAYWMAKINNLIPPVVEQPQYNMFCRHLMEREYVPFFAAPYNFGTTVWSPLDTGILTGKYVKGIPKDSRRGAGKLLSVWYGDVPQEKNDKVVKLMELAKELDDVSMVSLALGWVIKNKNVSVCMLGGSKPSQLEQNVAAIATAKKLTPDILKKIEEILDNKPQPDPLLAAPRPPPNNLTDPL